MVKKPKIGIFKYNLGSVLKVKLIREKQEKEKFAETQRKLEEEKRKEEEIKNNHRQAQNALREHFEEGKKIDFSQVFLRQNQIENLKEKVEVQKKIAIKAEEINEEQRTKLVDSMKEKKIIEKDKENKLKAWKDLMNKEEMKFIDEIATTKYNNEVI
ncbi:MAG: hypothetical protein DKM50_04575 [Candidatus Margulisiibacteriota bacterium]|nr:MAG: hypothetical protein A2X43_05715 [Candidatus Margulisbacteria bacterium GWD2_39_127]OGI01051.1 MAG: hypothetical protein A2X42_12355 [Candidatus Margulisbacteria bacterium GWF2_38_17]OGI09580.1 MAG: hypothetical protein A2X41_06560 [Candidatus Margulisbacteria bacterium GWE2_39_32]PZM82026.1 MAG: hypothetical protein DKM50_04575 [Candidatus Margulisiibacteriota bacterium]HCY35853.1 hypothetical protein [Candidatus Margulisiibacteriota bacterium]